MSNNYCLFSFAVPMPEKAARWAMRLNHAVNLIGQDVGCEEITFRFTREIIRTAKALIKDTGHYFTGADITYENGSLRISHDQGGYGCLENVTAILQATMRRFNLDSVVVIEWAETCSRPKVGEFHGGVGVITANDEHWMNTSFSASEMVQSLLGENYDYISGEVVEFRKLNLPAIDCEL